MDWGTLAGRRILLGVTGSIAAFKAPVILRSLVAAGAEVRVILTEAATHFVGSATYSGLGARTYKEMWEGPAELHVELAAWADTLVIAPATAETMAKLTLGRSDDLLSATALCFDGQVLVAPAMHPRMWKHAATQANARTLVQRGAVLIGPAYGEVASGDRGVGRLEEPEEIVAAVARCGVTARGALSGRHLVVTAGPTREAIDPVRALTNVSSGKMGYAIAAAARSRGARVTLVTGPVQLAPPGGVEVVFVNTAIEMQRALDSTLGLDLQGADALVMAAAVSDYRVENPSPTKLKRGGGGRELRLVPNPDLLRGVAARRMGLRPVLVGFALETVSEDELAYVARQKLIDKQVDMIVANLAVDGLGQDDNKVQLVTPRDCTPLPQLSKPQVAAHILDWIERRLGEDPNPETLA